MSNDDSDGDRVQNESVTEALLCWCGNDTVAVLDAVDAAVWHSVQKIKNTSTLKAGYIETYWGRISAGGRWAAKAVTFWFYYFFLFWFCGVVPATWPPVSSRLVETVRLGFEGNASSWHIGRASHRPDSTPRTATLRSPSPAFPASDAAATATQWPPPGKKPASRHALIFINLERGFWEAQPLYDDRFRSSFQRDFQTGGAKWALRIQAMHRIVSGVNPSSHIHVLCE